MSGARLNFIREAVAGHLGRPPAELEAYTVVGDGLGRHYLMRGGEVVYRIDHGDPLSLGVTRIIQGQVAEQWFFGSCLGTVEGVGKMSVELVGPGPIQGPGFLEVLAVLSERQVPGLLP